MRSSGSFYMMIHQFGMYVFNPVQSGSIRFAIDDSSVWNVRQVRMRMEGLYN